MPCVSPPTRFILARNVSGLSPRVELSSTAPLAAVFSPRPLLEIAHRVLTAFAVSARKSLGAFVPFDEEGCPSSCHQESVSGWHALFSLTFCRSAVGGSGAVCIDWRLLCVSAGGDSASSYTNLYLVGMVRKWCLCHDEAAKRYSSTSYD